MKSQTQYAAKLAPASFTVSITGHRNLEYLKDENQLRKLITDLLVKIDGICTKIDNDVELRFVTALAAGADQIGAKSALEATRDDVSKSRWNLHVVLPFDENSYKATLLDGLTESKGYLDQFDELLEHSTRVFQIADRSALIEDDDRGKAHYWNNVRFQTLGDILVRQADVLIAVWDGKVSTKKGGTTDVAGMAISQGKSVIWINPLDLTVSFLQPTQGSKNLVELASQSDPVLMSNAGSLLQIESALEIHISNALCFPDYFLDKKETNLGITQKKPVRREMIFETARAYFGLSPNSDTRKITNASFAELLRYEDLPFKRLRKYSWYQRLLAGRAFPETSKDWTNAVIYHWLTKRLISRANTEKFDDEKLREIDRSWQEKFRLRVHYASPGWKKCVTLNEAKRVYVAKQKNDSLDDSNAMERPDFLNTADEEIRDHTIVADTIATTRGHAYRSSYIVNFLGGALAVCIGLLGIIFSDVKQYFIGTEVFLLLGLLVLFVFVYKKSWHKRWLNARHIAESLRASRFLVWIGHGGRRSINTDAPWTAWHANTVMAASSIPNATITMLDIRYMTLELRKHVEAQENYHDSNSIKLRTMHETLDHWGKICVVAAIAIAVFYLCFFHVLDCFGSQLCAINENDERTAAFKYIQYFVSIFCAAMPVLSGAFMGIRFQGDFERFAERSEKTKSQLAIISDRLFALLCDIDLSYDMNNSISMPPFERLSSIILDMLEIYELDLEDWRFVYSARPSPEPG